MCLTFYFDFCTHYTMFIIKSLLSIHHHIVDPLYLLHPPPTLPLWYPLLCSLYPHTNVHSFFFFLINLFIYLFLAVLGLRCCMRAFSSCGELGLLFVAVRGLLIAVASLAVEHRL